MARSWESLLARRGRPVQIRRRLTWKVHLAAVGGIVFTAGLALRFIGPAEPVGHLFLAAAVLIWSVPPLIRWRRLTWAKRLGAVGGIVFTAGLVLSFIEPAKPVGHLFFAAAVLIWSVLPLIRWRRLTWAKRLGAAAAAVFVIAVAAGLSAHAEQVSIGNITGWVITILIFLALLSYFGTQLSRVTAPPATRVLIALGIVFLYGFPPLLAFLATNGSVSFMHLLIQQFNSGYGWLVSLQLLLQVLVPVLLIVLPEALRTRLAGSERSTTVEALLPIELAFVAALATGLYAVTLHFAKGPLAKISTNQLIFAALAVVVLLSPLYKYIVTACWKRGTADVFDPGNWVTKQKELVKLLRKAFAAPIEDATPDGVPNDARISPGTEVDTAISNPARVNPS